MATAYRCIRVKVGPDAVSAAPRLLAKPLVQPLGRWPLPKIGAHSRSEGFHATALEQSRHYNRPPQVWFQVIETVQLCALPYRTALNPLALPYHTPLVIRHALSLSPPTDTNCFDPTILDERPHRGVAEADDLAGGLHRHCQRSCALRHVAGNALGMDSHSSRRLSTRRIMPGGNRYERLSARFGRCRYLSFAAICRELTCRQFSARRHTFVQ